MVEYAPLVDVVPVLRYAMRLDIDGACLFADTVLLFIQHYKPTQ